MIISTSHISGKSARILIDLSATFSFISSNYVMHEKLGISDLNEPVIVSMPIGMCVVCKIVYKDVLVNVGEGEMRWNFIPLSINEFDAILGMDGLSCYQAKVNCYTRQVEFEKENGEKINFIGDSRNAPIRIISAMTAMKYLRKGYKAFLASIVEERKEGASLKELSVVNKFEDVFLEDLPGLLPEREI